ncbi:MAG: hypothetical protein Sapg2KO_14320 [Saprospiraceae bacterium]
MKIFVMKIKRCLIFLVATIISFGLNGQIDSVSGGKLRAWYRFSVDQKNIPNKPNDKDELSLVMFKDNTSIKGNLGNNSHQDVLVLTQDGSLIIISEALKEEKWIPIEFWIWSDCGNSYHEPLELKAQKSVDFDGPIFEGDTKTKLRLKMCTGQNIIYSNEILVEINDSYFNKLKPSFKKEYGWGGNFYINDCNDQLKEVKEGLEEMKILSEMIRNKN